MPCRFIDIEHGREKTAWLLVKRILYRQPSYPFEPVTKVYGRKNFHCENETADFNGFLLLSLLNFEDMRSRIARFFV